MSKNTNYVCSICGAEPKHVRGDRDWYCPNCDKYGIAEYDMENDQVRIVYDLDYYIDDDEEDYDDVYDEDMDDIPECCLACGGPYPQCMSSCAIFDD